jgi:hypothetical protein
MVKRKKKIVCEVINEPRREVFFEIIILLASVPIFRGIWYLLDIYLLPNDRLASPIVSVVMGIALLFAALYYFNIKKW